MSTHAFGPNFNAQLDGARLSRQRQAIRDFMSDGGWRTLIEIRNALGFADSSISAQLRHLRKPHFGSYQVEKRRRGKMASGSWEYRLLPPKPPITRSLFDQPVVNAPVHSLSAKAGA